MAEKIRTLIWRTKEFQLDRAARLFRASVEALKIENDAVVQDKVLTAIQNRGGELKELLKKHIATTANHLHPRLILVPFLRENALVGVATSVLREMNELVMDREPRTPIAGTLSYREAIAALGISTDRTLSSLCYPGFLETAGDFSDSNDSRRRGGISLASCDSVLRKLWRGHTSQLLDTRMRPAFMSLFGFMLQMMECPQHCGGYDLETGLSSLCIGGVKLQPTRPNSSQIEREDYLTLDAAADALGIKKYLVSSMAAGGWFKVIIDPSNPPAKLVCAHSVTKFNTEYVCFPRLSKENNFPASSHSTQRLKAAGVVPVGGPDVDGTKVYIFRKRDVDGLDIQNGQRRGIASLGEPLGGFAESARDRTPHDCVSLPDVAKHLGITLSQTRMLVNKSFLQQVRAPIVGVMILESSIESYRKMLNDFRFVELERAALSVAETKTQFLMRWIVTGVVKPVDLGLRVCVHYDDIRRIREIKRRFILAPDCARVWKVGRFKIPNMEKRGLIASTRMGDAGKVRLYLRADVEKLLGPAPNA